LYSGGGGTPGSDYGIEDECDGRRWGCGAVVGEVVVVFNWLKRGGFAEEAKMVDWYRCG